MKVLDLFQSFTPQDTTIHRPYIIAEAGVNHGGSMRLAKRLIEEAAEGGADAIKFQTYKAQTLASKDSPYYWDIKKEPTKSQFELFKKYDKFWKKEFEALKKHCDRCKIEFLSTPFDIASALFLNDLMDAFKVSSSDITNKPFIEYICRFKKPIILSTGASFIEEVKEAVTWIDAHKNKLALLHCVLNYPTKDQDAHLGMILDLKKVFSKRMIGYSDHTLPKDMKTMELAVLLGARILEKHFTYDKRLQGNDHYHAMDKDDLKSFKRKLDRTFELLGGFKKLALACEEPARLNARRSLVASRDIPKAKRITRHDLTCKRPAHGMSPKDMADVIGQCARRAIKADEIIVRNMIS